MTRSMPDAPQDPRQRRFGRAVILLGGVIALILIALFITPKPDMTRPGPNREVSRP